MKKILLPLLLIFVSTISAQVGIGTTTPAGALDVTSTTNGILIPRVALTTKAAAAPVVNPTSGALANGTLVFNIATAGVNPNNVVPGFYYWNTTAWVFVGNDSTIAGNAWNTTGNTGTTPGTNFIGTTDNQDLVFKTNNVQTARIDKSGASFSVGVNAGVGGSIDNTNFIGQFAGNNATNAFHSNFFGERAGSIAADARFSNFFGRGAGNTAFNAYNSNFFGENAGFQATDASNSNFIGPSAGINATNAFNSNFIGDQAGGYAATANTSNFIGRHAGYGATHANNSNFIGNNAGDSAENANSSNFIGRHAGNGATHANNSIFIGNRAGQSDIVNNTTVGFASILMGDDTSTGGFSNSIAIGKSAINDRVNQFLIGSSYSHFSFRGLNYLFPSIAGTSGQVLTNDGSGTLTWNALPSLSVQPYETLNTGGTYDVPLTSYTVRVFNGANTIRLPTPVGNTGKIFLIIGGVGIATKTFNSAAGTIFDDSAGVNVTALNAGQRYMVQSDGTNWIVIGR